METIFELARTYQRICKKDIFKLNISYDNDNELYSGDLYLDGLDFWFKISEDGTVERINRYK